MTAASSLVEHAPSQPLVGAPAWRAWFERRPAWFDFTTILLLQLSRIWGLWKWRDMPGGDTCSYFVSAYTWFRKGRVNFGFSPIYCSYWGEVLRAWDNVATAWMLHRLFIELALAVLVLAVMRRLLPRDLAWLVAAWWAVVPVNFDTLYEVHLFALLPILLAWLAILSRRGAWSGGTAIALMIVSTFLVRNEMVVSLACLALLCAAFEARAFRAGPWGDWRGVARTTLGYGVPIAISVGVVLFYFHRSDFKGIHLRLEMHEKHVVSMGQMYALGYADRHPEWGQNPWIRFEDAAQRDFGIPRPTLSDMLRRNPGALVRHAWWNVRLFPGAMQLLLFNAMSGTANPDVVAQATESTLALGLSVLVLVLWVAALARRWMARKADGATRGFQFIRALTTSPARPLQRSLEPTAPVAPVLRKLPQAFAWLAVVSIVMFCAPVIVVLRPRPAYLFSLSLLAMALVGVSLVVLVGRWRIWRRLSYVMPLGMIVLAIGVPRYYRDPLRFGYTPLADSYERLRPFAREFARKDTVYAGDYALEFQNYLGAGICRVVDYATLADAPAGESLSASLDRRKVNLLYVDDAVANALDADLPGNVETFLNTSDRNGWRVIGEAQPGGNRWWVLLRRARAEDAFAAAPHPVRFTGGPRFAGWRPLDGMEPFEGPYPQLDLPVIRWGLYPASHIVPADPASGSYHLHLSVLAPVPGQTLIVRINDRQVGKWSIPMGSFTQLSIPMELTAVSHRIELAYGGYQVPDPAHHPELRQSMMFKEIRLLRDEGK